MKKLLKKQLNLLLVFYAIFISGNIIIYAQSFKVSAVSDMVQVFEDGYKLPPLHDTLKIFGIRGEIISGQCVINAKNNLTNVTVELSQLKNQLSGSSLPSGSMEWNFVGYIPLSKNAPNQPESALVRKAPARFPEYLMAEKQLNIYKGSFQPLWITLNIPGNASAGDYSGNITIKTSQGEQSLPLLATIYPLSLPAVHHLKVTEWYNTRNFAKVHGIQEEYSETWFAMLRKYAENMAAHRQNVFQVPMNAIQITQLKDGKLEFDFTRFDKIAQVFWDTKKMDYLETGELMKFEKDWYSTRIIPKDFSVKNSESGEKISLPGTEVIPALLPAFENHLRQKGWLCKTLFHIKDEPSVYNTPSWREMSAYIHKYAPDLKRIDAIETSFILSDIEVACPQIDHLGTWYEDFRRQALNGTEIWIYSVGIYQATSYPNKTIDVPLIDSRMMHWVNYRYDLTGYLHWGWNQWTDDPFKEVGMHIGDGWHVYPAKDGVLNSLRWEQMRNGIQDYEYFWLLENKVKSLKDSLGSYFSWIDPTQRGKEISGRIVKSLADQKDDPQLLNNAKREIIRELLEFDVSPRVYVQVNPMENSTIKSISTVEIYGWAEPGTKIVFNGKELPLSQQGRFLSIMDLTTKRNIIKIQATNSGRLKEIVREFNVEF